MRMGSAFLVCLSLITMTIMTQNGANSMEKTLGHIKVQIDHFVVGISELDKGIEEFAERTGVKPVPGGKHRFVGTHNALVSLGNKMYLEILAPLPGMDKGLFSKISKLTPLTWAVRTNDIQGLKKKLRKMGFDTTEPIPGFRTTPEGSKLEWSALMIIKPTIKGIPFFIQWKGQSVHPSETSPLGCILNSFEVFTPTPDLLKGLLRRLGLTPKVKKSTSPVIRLSIHCLRGEVQL